MSSDGLVVYAFLHIMTAIPVVGVTQANAAPTESGVYCAEVAPLLVARWEAMKNPDDMVFRHEDDFTLVSIRRAGDVVSISLQGDFSGMLEDSNADGIVDKGPGGMFGGGYDSSSPRPGKFSKAQSKYEKECEALWPILQPPGQ